MNCLPNFAPLLERFFTQRLMTQKRVSPNTIASYRDAFRLLLIFAQKQLNKAPAELMLSDLDAPIISLFLDDLESGRGISIRSRNLRLTAIRSFYRYAAYYEPSNASQIQQVLAIPSKRYEQHLVKFLTHDEIEALLASPNLETWCGRRDQIYMMTAIQTGMRLSEMTNLRKSDFHAGTGAHIYCVGKGRKERCTPVTTQMSKALTQWSNELTHKESIWLFPTIRGGKLSADAVQSFVAKHSATARQHCTSLNTKKITPHTLRHTAAMELLQAGVDITVIALWLGHQCPKTTQIYLDANLAIKEGALKKISSPNNKIGRYRPDDKLLAFLKTL